MSDQAKETVEAEGDVRPQAPRTDQHPDTPEGPPMRTERLQGRLEAGDEGHSATQPESVPANSNFPIVEGVEHSLLSKSIWENIADEGGASNDDSSREYLRSLIVGAYEAAKASGKADWQLMSTAVLKNRISQISGAKFDEKRFGYSRITDLVRDFPELLALDDTHNPPISMLLTQSTSRSVLDASHQIRPDLWKAIMDFQSRETYVLADGYAVPASVLSDTPAGTSSAPALPTISSEEFDRWRRDFAFLSADLVKGRPDQATRLEQWTQERSGTSGLPGVLRGRWNLYLKNAVLQRLSEWFDSKSLQKPSDMIQKGPHTHNPKLAQQRSEEGALRQALIEAISLMNLEELKQISLPAGSLLRRRR